MLKQITIINNETAKSLCINSIVERATEQAQVARFNPSERLNKSLKIP